MIPPDFDPYSIDIQLLQSFDSKVIQDSIKNIEKMKKKAVKSSNKTVVASPLPNIVEMIVNDANSEKPEIDSQIVNDIVNASKPNKPSKAAKEPKEKVVKEKVVKEPKEKEVKEKVVKEKVVKEKVVKEKVVKEKVAKEPKEKVVKEKAVKEKVAKEPKVKEENKPDEIVASEETTNELQNINTVATVETEEEDEEEEIECNLYTSSDGTKYLLDQNNNIYDVDSQEHIGTLSNSIVTLF
jgi:hypothetical protein